MTLAKNRFILMVFLGFASVQCKVFAGQSPFGYIEGRVVSWDEKNVTLTLRNGKSVSVSRSTIPQFYSIREKGDVIAYLKSKDR